MGENANFGSAATGAELKKRQKYQDICAGIDFIPGAIESSGIWDSAVSMLWNWSRRLDAGFQKSATNHGEHRSFVSSLLWLFNAAMPPALLGRCRSTVQWTSCSLPVFVVTLTIIIIIIIIITTKLVCDVYCNSCQRTISSYVERRFRFCFLSFLSINIIIILKNNNINSNWAAWN